MRFLDWLMNRSMERRTKKSRELQRKMHWDGASCHICGGQEEVVWRDFGDALRPVCILCDTIRKKEKSQKETS
jgi:hypothetical protein